jgi:hypothetical protein
MTNESQSRKISEFLALSSLPADTQVTFISGGTNYKMTLADFQAALGVTGSIVQAGDPAASPVLDDQGAIKAIRNLEDGNGIIISVSPQNGLTVSHNFQRLTEGLPVVSDLTVSSPTFKSLIAGTDITLSETGNKITISRTGAAPPVSTKTVQVQQLSDLPTASGGVVTLAAETDYLFQNDISVGTDRFQLSDNTVIRAADSQVIKLTYTGTGTMFTGVDIGAQIKEIALDCPNGQLMDISSSVGGKVFQISESGVDNCQTIGVTSGMAAVQFNQVNFNNVVLDGWSCGGGNSILLIQSCLATMQAGTFLDLASGTYDAVSIISLFTTLNGSSVGLSGLSNSGNINVGGLGSVVNSRFFGAGTPLNTISPNDSLWQFAENDDIADTRPDGLLSVNGPLTVAISAANTPVKIGALSGDWVAERTSQMVADTNGRLTFTGGKDFVFPLLGSVSAEPVSGTNKTLTFYIAINGSIVANSGATTTVSSGGPKNTPVPWQANFNPADYLELWVENNSDATDVAINSGILRAN